MITKDEILSAQKAWGDALIEIGKLKENRNECEALTSEIIDRYYAYDLGNVLFKPTRTSDIQFRGTREGAIAYFIGGSESYSEDTGFALQPWTKVDFDNAGGMFIYEDYAVAMGNYFFTEAGTGNISKVEYTFGYIKDAEGALKINLHHSSVPFKP